MDVRVLGPVEVLGGALPVPLEPAQRTVLARLAAPAGQRVAIDGLIDALWPDGPPRTARKTLQGHIARLRRAIGENAIVSRAGGYLLDLDQVETDVSRVETLIEKAREASSAGRADEAARLLRVASGMFRGRPFEDVPERAVPPGEHHRLEELEAVVFEERIDAELAAGRHRSCVGELESFVQANPLRERGWAQLMVALYRSHRQADALSAYRRLRRTLAEELGIEPSTELVRLEQSILVHDPALERPPDAEPIPPESESTEPNRGADVPPNGSGVGRERGHFDSPSRLSAAGAVAAKGPQTRAVMFTDVEAATEWRSNVGDPVADAVTREHDDLMAMAVQRHRGSLVKGLGDGVMVVFTSATDALDCAVTIQHQIARFRRRHSVPLHVRIGIAAGDVAFERDDYFGAPVIEAARLTTAAPPDEILVSELVCRLAGSRAPAPLSPPEAVALKGLSEVEACRVEWRLVSTPQVVPLPELLAIPSENPLAGRDVELDQLHSAWGVAEKGRCCVVMISGEPGVGKTRLVTEAADRARADGGIVAYGRCDDGLGAPFRPMVEALRHIVRHLPAAELTAVTDHAGPDLVRLLPELEERFDQSVPAGAEVDVARVRLFDAVTEFVAALGIRAPLVLALDDLQWVDDATLLLLRHVVTRSPRVPLLVLGTYRDTEVSEDHPLLGLVADLRRDANFQRIALTGLDKPAVAALVQAADEGGNLSTAVGGLLDRTNGNPFFILQLVHHLAEQTESDADPADANSVPEGVRDVIRRRLARLPDRVSAVLRLAAVIGETFDLALLESVDRKGDELDAVEAAVAAALVAETTNPTRFRFVHALVRETLYEDMSAARRNRLHNAIGQALSQSPSAPAADVARHLRAGTPFGGVDEAIDWSMRAIEEAYTKLAREDVAAHAAAALTVLDRAGEGPSERRARLLCELAAGCSWLGEMAGNKDHALAAADIARAVGSPALLVQAALLYSEYLTPAAPDPIADQLLEEALRVAGPDPAQRSKLVCNRALYRAINEGTGFAGARELLEEAVSLARSSGDDMALAWTMATRSVVLLGTADVDAQLRTASELEEVLNRSPQTRSAARDADFRSRLGPTTSIVLRHRGVGALQKGDRATFGAAHRELRILAEANRHWLLGAIATLWDGLVALMDGRLRDVESALNRLVEGSRGDANLVNSYGVQMFQLRRDQGRVAEALPAFEHLVATSEGLVAAQALLALIYSDLGRNDEARRIFDGLAAHDFAALSRDLTWSGALAVLAELCWRLRDKQRAAVLDRLCEPYAGQLVVLAWGVCCIGAMDRYRAMLADVLGETELADKRFALAATLEDRANAVVPLTRTRLAWAASIRRLDEASARRLLTQATATVDALALEGLQPAITRVQQTLATSTQNTMSI